MQWYLKSNPPYSPGIKNRIPLIFRCDWHNFLHFCAHNRPHVVNRVDVWRVDSTIYDTLNCVRTPTPKKSHVFHLFLQAQYSLLSLIFWENKKKGGGKANLSRVQVESKNQFFFSYSVSYPSIICLCHLQGLREIEKWKFIPVAREKLCCNS